MRPNEAWTGSFPRMMLASNSNASTHKYKADRVLVQAATVSRHPGFAIDGQEGESASAVPPMAPDQPQSDSGGTSDSADGPSFRTFSHSGDRRRDYYTGSVWLFSGGDPWAILSRSWGILNGSPRQDILAHRHIPRNL